jgi:hypothetical protein
MTNNEVSARRYGIFEWYLPCIHDCSNLTDRAIVLNLQTILRTIEVFDRAASSTLVTECDDII